jgi:hypothetical protein
MGEIRKAHDAGDDEKEDALSLEQEGVWDELSLEEKGSIDVEDWPEYVKCVSLDQNGGSVTVCGRNYPGWKFMDWEHADRNRANKGRLLTCEICEARRTDAGNSKAE